MSIADDLSEMVKERRVELGRLQKGESKLSVILPRPCP
jgi:hypothetical protein